MLHSSNIFLVKLSNFCPMFIPIVAHVLYKLAVAIYGVYVIHLIGHILSDWMSIRHYCMTQLRTVWFHMRTNMALGDEERSFFIMNSMHRLFMVSVLNNACTVCYPFSFGSCFKNKLSFALKENLVT